MTQLDLPEMCARRWGRWLFKCPYAPRHECTGTRHHAAALHRCRWCGALLIVGIL